MIDEIELFYKTVEASIREVHAVYLKEQKRVPLVQELPEVDELPDDEEWRKLGFFARLRLRIQHARQVRARNLAERRVEENMDDRLLKGYNAGIEQALKVLSSEYGKFEKRVERASQRDGIV